ncbi:MAG: PrgI family protein [Candidatus Komeilibacteria bacterium]
MRKFIVPQFIDIEDKIIGSITTRQFITLIVTGILIFTVYKLFEFNLFLVQAVIILAIGGSFAFLKINGTPMHIFILNFLSRFAKPDLRVWQKEDDVVTQVMKQPQKAEDQLINKPRLSARKLSELALVVDTGGVYRGEERANFANQSNYGQGT